MLNSIDLMRGKSAQRAVQRQNWPPQGLLVPSAPSPANACHPWHAHSSKALQSLESRLALPSYNLKRGCLGT